MGKMKKWIIIIGIMIILLLIALISLIANLSSGSIQKQGNIKNDVVGAEAESVELETKITQVKDYNTFYTIENNLQKYFLYAKAGNEQALDDLIIEEYKNKNQITKENIVQYIPKIEDTDSEFFLRQLYINDSRTHPTYYAYGDLLQNNKKSEYYYIVYTDQTNLCWGIEPIQKQEYEEKIKKDKKNEEKTITKKQYNTISQKTVTKEEIAKKYFKDYIYQAVHDAKAAYDLLEPQYQKAKFNNVSEYEQYIKAKQTELISMDIYSIKKLEDFNNEDEYAQYLINLEQKGLRQYSVIEKKSYTLYICIDDYGNYYIFNETAPMQYTVILDTYTIDLPEFIEKYNNSTEEQKVLLNIQKCFEAINQKDYKYVYNKLDATFKSNNFKTQAEFEEYAKKNFFAQNKVAAENPQKQGSIYLYDITISDSTGKDATTKKKNFVMQLKEGTDFVMSFGV